MTLVHLSCFYPLKYKVSWVLAVVFFDGEPHFASSFAMSEFEIVFPSSRRPLGLPFALPVKCASVFGFDQASQYEYRFDQTLLAIRMQATV